MKSFPKQDRQKELVKNSLKTRAYIKGDIPITARSMTNYSLNIFPDVPTAQLVSYVSQRDYLDVACGINHLYPSSLLSQLKGSKKKHGLDIHSKSEGNYFKGSIYKTSFKPNSYDCITINNFLYFWEYKSDNLLKIYKELYRISKPGGEIRVFPVFFGNYHQENIELFDYLNENFVLQVLKPENDYSNESAAYLQDGEIKSTRKSDGRIEYTTNKQLMAHVLVLRKK